MPWKDDGAEHQRDMKAGGKEHFEGVAIVPGEAGKKGRETKVLENVVSWI